MIRLFLSQPRVFFIFIFFLISQAKAGSLDVGVYYYPGWNKPGVEVWEPHSPLDPVLRSLVSARIAQLCHCEFCIDITSMTLAARSGSQDKL
ncbi:carboxymuconolactone decarboxylase family protein, partial [Klebsiella pneumoniae]|uniref:carboxymuconolactone decarboxylase family protein n=1 Tax=Klebsiella pneumoniae TaxID=573 RepID=UPI003745615F